MNSDTAAAARVVRTAYAHGELGSAADVRPAFANVPESAYLDAQGKFKPLAEMSPQAQRDFRAWLVELQKQKRWRTKIGKAQTAAYRRAHCDSSA